MLSRGTMRAERSSDPLDRHSRLSLLWCMAHQHFLADAQPGFRSPGIRVRHASPQAAKSRMAACESPTIDCPALLTNLAWRLRARATAGSTASPLGSGRQVRSTLARLSTKANRACWPRPSRNTSRLTCSILAASRSSAPTSSSHRTKILYARWRYVHDQAPGQELPGELMERRTSTFEKHYHVKELTVLWGLGRETVRKISEDGPQEGAHRLRGAGIGSASNSPTADRITLTNGHGRRNPICSICRIAGEFAPCVGLAPARAWVCRRRLP